jgi:hypothetical protein
MSPATGAVLASATFETGADSNTAMTFTLFGSLSMELRFVDEPAYVQLPPELLLSLGLETAAPDAWLTVDEASAAELGVGCPSPLSDTATLLPELVDDATIVGRETLRGFETTMIRLTLSVQYVIGLRLESVPDLENGGGDPDASRRCSRSTPGFRPTSESTTTCGYTAPSSTSTHSCPASPVPMATDSRTCPNSCRRPTITTTAPRSSWRPPFPSR